MRMSPTAIGMDVVPTLKRFRKGTMPGSAQPEKHAEDHRGEDPQRQIAIKKAKASGHFVLHSVS